MAKLLKKTDFLCQYFRKLLYFCTISAHQGQKVQKRQLCSRAMQDKKQETR
jgi:hypothetical protein